MLAGDTQRQFCGDNQCGVSDVAGQNSEDDTLDVFIDIGFY